jgi:hypothetical protein
MSTKSNEFANSIVRTGTAIFVGSVVTYLLANWLNANYSLRDPSAEVMFFSISAGYYIIVRTMERYVSDRFGWLLFSAGGPAYPSVSWNPPKEKKRELDRRREQPQPRHAMTRR